MALHGKTGSKRDQVLTVRIRSEVRSQLEKLAIAYKLSQADVVEQLVEQEAKEHRRLKSEDGLYKLTSKKRFRR